MNDKVLEFMRKELKEGLSLLPESMQTIFKRMYSHNNLDKPINDVVDDMGIFAGMIAFGWMMNIENTYHGERETE